MATEPISPDGVGHVEQLPGANARLWRAWKAFPKKNGDGFDKVPTADGRTRMAKWQEPPYMTLDEARAVRGADGVGLVLMRECPDTGISYTAIDVDKCIVEGRLVEPAQVVLDVARRHGAYVDVSPSGHGLHLVGPGTATSCEITFKENPKGEVSRTSLRFLTMTGALFGEYRGDPEASIQQVIVHLRGVYGGAEGGKKRKKDAATVTADPKVIEAARTMPNASDREEGVKFGCPACQAAGRDTSQDNAFARFDGMIGCAVDKSHAAVIREALRRIAYPPAPPPPVTTLKEVHEVVQKCFGASYDLAVFDAALATAAAERLPGDPLWLMVIGGSGETKTETLMSLLYSDDVHVLSQLTSEGSLLSGTSKRERDKGATGGLLRTIGDRGLVLFKDFTSTLSMRFEARAGLLAALREVYDGYYKRCVGTGGGSEHVWKGRVGLVGAVTTAWDQHHSVIATMGDRFVNVRVRGDAQGEESRRTKQGEQALDNTGRESAMRDELRRVVAGLLANIKVPATLPELNPEERTQLLKASDIATRCRTAVETDFKGTPTMGHALEANTRFPKQLLQLWRGALLIGLDRERAMGLVVRCARDSMPPLRLAILEDLAKNPKSTYWLVSKRIDKPRTTVDQACQALHLLGAVTVVEEDVAAGKPVGKPVEGQQSLDLGQEPVVKTSRRWLYTVSRRVEVAALEERRENSPGLHEDTNKRSGESARGSADSICRSSPGVDEGEPWEDDAAPF